MRSLLRRQARTLIGIGLLCVVGLLVFVALKSGEEQQPSPPPKPVVVAKKIEAPKPPPVPAVKPAEQEALGPVTGEAPPEFEVSAKPPTEQAKAEPSPVEAILALPEAEPPAPEAEPVAPEEGAAGEPAPTREMTGADKLRLADSLSVKAVKKAARARSTCDCELFREAVQLAYDAAVMISEAAAEAGRNTLQAQEAYDVAAKIVGAAATFIGQTGTHYAMTGKSAKIRACFCECDGIRQSLALADKLAALVSQTAAEAKETGNIQLSMDACRMGNAVGATLGHIAETWSHCLRSREGLDNAVCLCDCGLSRRFLELANRLAVPVSEAAIEAERAGSIELAQYACNAAKSFLSVFSTIGDICDYCARTSTDPATVACCQENRARAEGLARFNDETIRMSLLAGAIPSDEKREARDFKPVIEEEPIQDHEQPPVQDYERPPASPV